MQRIKQHLTCLDAVSVDTTGFFDDIDHITILVNACCNSTEGARAGDRPRHGWHDRIRRYHESWGRGWSWSMSRSHISLSADGGNWWHVAALYTHKFDLGLLRDIEGKFCHVSLHWSQQADLNFFEHTESFPSRDRMILSHVCVLPVFRFFFQWRQDWVGSGEVTV